MKNLRCPFCREDIDVRADAVQCTLCMAALHRDCWGEAGRRCTTRGCGSDQTEPLTRRATAKIVIGKGRRAVELAMTQARERLGGKSIVSLLTLSILTYGLIAAPLLATKHVQLTTWLITLLGGLFLILTTWITTLLYRGGEIDDDLEVEIAKASLGDYYPHLGSGGSGCNDTGCSGVDGEGALLALAIIGIVLIAVVVLPFLAWLAIELVIPLIVLTIYGVLYGALAMAVNGADRIQGRLLPCLARGALWGLIYTGIVTAIVLVGVLVTRDPAPRGPLEAPVETRADTRKAG